MKKKLLLLAQYMHRHRLQHFCVVANDIRRSMDKYEQAAEFAWTAFLGEANTIESFPIATGREKVFYALLLSESFETIKTSI